VKLGLNDHPGYIHTDESILSFSDSHAGKVLADLGRPPPAPPSFDMDLSGLFQFARDPKGQFHPIRVGVPWEQQGHPDYHGLGWYRASVRLPAKLPATLYLYLGEVSGSYRVFVNGREATHSGDHWPRRLTYTDIAPYVSAGRDNEIELRIEGDQHGEGTLHRSGILRGPVDLRDIPPPARIAFDLSDEKQAEVFMRDLHGPLMDEGVDLWWVDGGSGASAMPGLNAQLWTNKVFYDFSQRHTGQRAFILGRYGEWGSQRYPGFFTGDAYSEWPVLAYQVAFSARGGNVLVPYISHDIGGFHGREIDFELYARWLEFGTFSAILRMHGAHENPREGNLRMPWIYGKAGIELMRRYFTLRTELIPYIFSYAWVAHTRATPLLRPLYLAYPQLEEAYRHPHEYFFGEQLLVAPVLQPGGEQTIYLPPGDWRDFFTGKRYQGGTTLSAHYRVDETPVFVREGAIIPEQPASDYSDATPLERLVLEIYGPGDGAFDLYEDNGVSLDYEQQHAHTAFAHSGGNDGLQRLVIEATSGTYPAQPPARAYELRIHTDARPSVVSVNGRAAGAWTWDAQQALATVTLPSESIHDRIIVEWR
jgi:hypothetical protein